MKEKDLENKIKKYLSDREIYHFKIHGSNFMEPGLPDIIVCCKGKFIGIEVKNPNGKGVQSEYQKIHERNIIKSGGKYWLIDNYDDFVKLIEKELE